EEGSCSGDSVAEKQSSRIPILSLTRGMGIFVLRRTASGKHGWRPLEDAGGQDNAGTAIMQRDGEGEHAPGKALPAGIGVQEQVPPRAVDVRLTRFRDVPKDLH